VLRNAACAPFEATERARAAAARGGALCYDTLDAAAAAIAAGKRWSAARVRARHRGEGATIGKRG